MDYGIRWKVPLFAIGIGVVTASFLCIAWLPGGLRPIGPISLDYGWKLNRRKGESPSEWHFTIGAVF